MKVSVVSLGCNKNLVDTEVMLGHLHKAGCVVVEEPEDADCLLINTCSFLTEAVEESLDRIVELAQLKREGGPTRLVVTGCLVSRYGDEILKEVPEVDALVPHKDLESVVRAVKGDDQNAEPGTQNAEELNSQFSILNSESSFPFRIRSHPSHRAYIKIGEGCSNWCAYCLIPSIRGEFTSRPAASLLSEMEYLVGQDVREVTLVAQDSGRYGQDLGKDSLPSLLRSLLGVPGDYWLRVLYVHPSRVTDEILEVIGSDPRICRYLDVPFQHVSASVLERMGRGEAPSPMDVVRRVRNAIPGVYLRTTLMTGFPGETEEDFNELLHFIQEAGIDHLGVFPYSLEEGTPAAGMKNQVPSDVARSRADKLMEEQAGISAQRLSRLVGQELTVLAEGFDEKGPFGRHQGQAPEVDGVVRLDEDIEPGTFVRVLITDSDIHDLKGEVLDSDPETPAV
ncbi:MAG: 30S ribosomal protein S12 methylthiotransferase RimO [bacterium]|nr:30S ribosomal protein S12 methylthiotransferase RimO [bacterium]MDT8367388.1 30S ribosomal protein S12 methylthiotransferase RimO [bacterium]